MDFTREPIIETIITPREGYKLVIRSSTSAGQEEYFVDAVEIVAFGNALFFRSLERPKSFLVPVSDYEVVEVREARMVLKNVGLERSIKIGGGRESNLKPSREVEKAEPIPSLEISEKEETQVSEISTDAQPEVRVEKKRDRRRHYRKRKGRDEMVKEEGGDETTTPSLEGDQASVSTPEILVSQKLESPSVGSNLLSSLLQPPSTLISETINRYRQNEMFKNAFYLSEEEQYKPHDKVQDLLSEDDDEDALPILKDPVFETEELEGEQSEPASFDLSVEDSDERYTMPQSLEQDNEQQSEQDNEQQSKEQSSDEFEEADESIEKKSDQESSSLTFPKEDSESTSSFIPLYAQEEDVSMWKTDLSKTSQHDEKVKKRDNSQELPPEEH